MSETRVVIVDCNYKPNSPGKVFSALTVLLAKQGVNLTVDNCWCEDYIEADLIIGADPLRDSDTICRARILGQRTLNRKTRLDIAERAGADVVPFDAPENDQQLDAVVAEWPSNKVVLKYDWSARRNGVFLWPMEPADRSPFPVFQSQHTVPI